MRIICRSIILIFVIHLMKKRRFALYAIALCILLPAFIGACQDDDFSIDPACRLSFSTDTVSFDTVFTTIGSATYRLMVYNRNDKNLNIASIRLPNAEQSGFRVNVDGHQGTDFTNIEIRRRDSMYVFIEVNVNPTSQNNPILIKDSLVFLLESGVQQDVKLRAYGRDVLKLHGPVLSKDTTFTAWRPILVYDSLQVNEGATLTLERGTELYFHDQTDCIVKGRIIANGTLGEPVVFRGDRLDRMTELDLPYDRVAGQWGGIHLHESSYENIFNYADIHGGNYGIRCDSSDRTRMKLLLENSVVHNVKGNCLDIVASKVQVGNSQITNAGNNCVSILGGDAVFIHCTIANFYSWDVRKGDAVYIVNKAGDISYPLERAFFYNCLITGSSSDELNGGAAEEDTTAFNYGFTYSLINTVLDEDDENYDLLLQNNYPDCIWDDKEDENGESLARDRNFLYIGREDFDYDFRLDSASAAINIGAPQYAYTYPMDRNGRDRLGDSAPDAGCYEWMPGDMRREE